MKKIKLLFLIIIACLVFFRIYDNRTLKTDAKHLIKAVESTCENQLMDCIDYIEGMRQPKEYTESKNDKFFTIKLVVKRGCEDKILHIISEHTRLTYFRDDNNLRDSEITDSNIIAFSINGEWNDILTKNIIFKCVIQKNGRRYNPSDIYLYGVEQQNENMVIYCLTYAKRDRFVWKIFDYLYFYEYGNLVNFAIFSLGLTSIMLLVYLIIIVLKCKLKFGKKKTEYVNKKKMMVMCGLIVFIGIAFFLNLVINFPIIIRNSNYYNFKPNCVEANHTGIWKLVEYASYCKITNYELIRSVIEMISFVPIGILLNKLFNRAKICKCITFVVCISVLFELFGNWGYISHYYYQTLFNNILGGLAGLGITTLCIPIVLAVGIYGFCFVLGNTNIFSTVYPDYYSKVDSENLNVEMSNEECLDKELQLNNALSEQQYNLCSEKLNINISADADANDAISNVYYNNNQLEDMLDSIGVLYKRKEGNVWFENAVSFTSYNEISDGVYERCYVYIEFDENKNPIFSDINSTVEWGLTVNHWKLKDYSWYIMPNWSGQGLNKIVSIEESYKKLCNGEGYAKGLVELCSKGKVDIEVKDVDIVMHIDNMNCYEHVYCFYIEPITAPDGTLIDRIYVPAMKSYY